MADPTTLRRNDSAIFLVDAQARLMPAIEGGDRVVARCRFLLDAAQLMNLPVIATEQYRKGLGPTVDELAEFALDPVEKSRFGGGAESAVLDRLRQAKAANVVIIGIEAHVCVMQTAFDLLRQGFKPFVAADAVGSRRGEDKAIALARMAQAGIVVVTTEAAAFELLETAAAKEFKAFSQLVKDADAAERAYAESQVPHWRP